MRPPSTRGDLKRLEVRRLVRGDAGVAAEPKGLMGVGPTSTAPSGLSVTSSPTLDEGRPEPRLEVRGRCEESVPSSTLRSRAS